MCEVQEDDSEPQGVGPGCVCARAFSLLSATRHSWSLFSTQRWRKCYLGAYSQSLPTQLYFRGIFWWQHSSFTMASYDVFRQGKKSVYSKRHLTWRQYRNIVDSKTFEKHAFTHLFIYSFSSYTAKVQLCYSHILHRNITNSRFQGHVSQYRCSRLFVDVDTLINYLNILAKRGIRT